MTRRRLTLLALLAVGLAAIAGTLAGRWLNVAKPPTEPANQELGDRPVRAVLFESVPVRVDLGTLGRGGRTEWRLVVFNPSPSTVIVEGIKTSCDCFRIQLDRPEVGAGEEAPGRLVIDLSDEPDFTGGLSLEATASTAEGEGRAAISLRLSVQVK